MSSNVFTNIEETAVNGTAVTHCSSYICTYTWHSFRVVYSQGIFPLMSFMNFEGLKPNSCQLYSQEFRFEVYREIHLKGKMRELIHLRCFELCAH